MLALVANFLTRVLKKRKNYFFQQMSFDSIQSEALEDDGSILTIPKRSLEE